MSKTEILISYYNLAAVYMEKRNEKRKLQEESTCLDLLAVLSDENERFHQLAFDRVGNISNRIRIFRNGKLLTDPNEILRENDEIIIFSAISGG